MSHSSQPPQVDDLDDKVGFKDTPLGPLPEEWKIVTIGDLAEKGVLWIKNGYAQGEHNQDSQGVPHLRPFNVSTGGQVDLSQIKYVQPPAKDSLSWVKAGDVIFNNTNSEELVGKTAYFDLGGQYVLSNHMTIIRVNTTSLDARWLSEYLYFLWYKRVFQALCRRHVNQASVGLDRLRGVQVSLPPLPEQRAIAHILSSVRQSIEAAQRVIEAAQALKRSLMKHLFTYGPVTVEEAGTVSLKETNFGNFPESWILLPLDKCAHVQTGTAKGRKFGNAKTVSVPYLRVANVQDGFLDLTEIKDITIKVSELPRYQLQNGDILLTEGGDFDKLGRGFIWHEQVPGCVHQNHIFAVRVDRSKLLPEYFAYLIQSDYGKSYFLTVAHRTTHLASINSTKLKALPVVFPPIEEQRKITDSLTSIDAKIRTETQRKAALEALFQSLLHNLMTGKVRAAVHE